MILHFKFFETENAEILKRKKKSEVPPDLKNNFIVDFFYNSSAQMLKYNPAP